MSWLLITVICWFFLWFLPSFVALIWKIRQSEDIALGDLLLILCITIVGGPIFFLVIWLQNRCQSSILEKVIIRRCKYKKAWEILRNSN